MKPTYFDLTVRDIGQARAFFEKVLGWRFDVLEAGGSIVESKVSIPGVGWYATCTEPGGLKFGLIQTAPIEECRREG